MSTFKPLLVLAGVIAASLASLSPATPPVSGKFVAGDKTYDAVDAIAWRDDGTLRLDFSDHVLDRAALAEDGALDSLDFMPDDGATYTVSVDDRTSEVSGVGAWSENTNRFVTGIGEKVVLDHRDETRIAGRFTADDGTELVFDLPITGSTIERPGTALPADGGEPGEVLLARIAAVHAGDMASLIANTPPDQAAAMREAVANGEAEQLLAMARLFTPTDIVVTGGQQDGDTAWVDFAGSERSGKVTGTGKLQRTDGRWQVESIKTANVAE